MSKRQFLFGVIAILILHVGLVLFFGMQKQGFHEDEYYSYGSVSSENLVPQNFTWHYGHDLQRRFLVRDGEQFSFDLVIKNQAEDVHPPLYYLALHIVMSLAADSFYKWFGILLNLMFSVVTYVAIVFLFWRLGKHKETLAKPLALLAGAVYACAPSTISMVMLTRMYAMSTMWTVLYAVIFVMLIKSKEYSRRQFAGLTFCGAVVVYCASLTHYYALFCPFFLTFAYCIYSLILRSGIIRMLIYGSSMLVSIGGAVLTYPACITHIFGGYRGTDALNSIVNGSLRDSLFMFGDWINSSVWGGWLVPCFIVFAICAIISCVMNLSSKRFSLKTRCMYIYEMGAIGITCFLTFALLTKCSLAVGEASCRYFYPVIAIILPYMAYIVADVVLELKRVGANIGIAALTKQPVNIIVWILVVVVSGIPLLHTYAEDKVLFLYREDGEKVAFSQAHSQYPLILIYEKDLSYRSWYVDNQIWPFERVLYVENDYISQIDDPTISEAEKIVVYMDGPEEYLQIIMEENPNLSSYTLVRHDAFFYVYLLE